MCLSVFRSRRISRCWFQLALVIGLVTACGPIPAGAQSPWQQLKDQAKKAKEQLKQAAHPQQAPQPGQSNTAPGTQPSARGGQQPASQEREPSGPIHPPQGTKVEETVMAPLAPGAKFFLSPHGVHVATWENSGSRAVVYHDGVPGPKFDEILGEIQIVFSPDGKRYAYCGRLGNEMVVMVDGKELLRSSDSWLGQFSGKSCQLGFTSNSKHVYFIGDVATSESKGESYTRFLFDGKAAPRSKVYTIHPVFSPDGDHYAYVVINPADEQNWGLVIDGKMAPYRGSNPQWTADSQHLYTTIEHPGATGYTEAMLDGKPIMRADILHLHVAPAGNMFVAEVYAATRTPTPVQFLVVDGKKVPGSEIVYLRGAQIDQVTISPDGKHYAARFTTTQGHQYIFADGKRGQEYQTVDHIVFTADSSKVTYTAFSNAKPYVIIGDQESDTCGGALTLAPVGGRAATVCGPSGGAALYMDGKMSPLPGGALSGSDLRFSPDGQHYAYDAWFQGGAQRLTIDGVVQMNSNLGTPSNPRNHYVFSPDSQHIAVDSAPPTPTGDYSSGLFLDGKYIPVVANVGMRRLEFTADSKHIAWAQSVPGRNGFRIYVDGKAVTEADAAMTTDWREPWWEMAPDGSLSVLAQDENNLKRITITPSPETSVAAMVGSGGSLARAR